MPSGAAIQNSVGTEDASSCGAILEEIMAMAGVSGTEPKARAMVCLNRAIKEVNADKLWMDRLLRTDVDLAADTPSFDLPARWAMDRGWAWLLDTDDKRYLGVQFLPFTDFLKEVSTDTAEASIPRFFTVENRANSGQFEIYPRISTTNLALYPKMRIFYFADIPTCKQDGDFLQLSGSMENYIVDAAAWRLNRMLGDGKKDTDLERRTERSRKKVRMYDNRLRLRLGPIVGYK